MRIQLLIVAAVLIASASAFGPKSHEYQFHDNYASGVSGVPDLMPFNAAQNTFTMNDWLVTPYSMNNMDMGLMADFRAQSNNGFTIDMRFKLGSECPAGNQSGWRKIIDTADCDGNTTDYGVYVGEKDGRVAVIYHSPNSDKLMGSMDFPWDQWVQVYFDYDRSENKVTAFQNDMEIFSIVDPEDCTFKNFNSKKVNLFHDDGSNYNEAGPTYVDYVEFHEWCAPGTWFDECKNTCEPCDCGCKTCDGPTNWHCDCCEEGYYLFDSPMSEAEKLNEANWFVYPDGHITYPDESCRRCANTMPHCIGCTWFNECYHCEMGWVLKEDKTGCMPWTQEWQDAQDAMNN